MAEERKIDLLRSKVDQRHANLCAQGEEGFPFTYQPEFNCRVVHARAIQSRIGRLCQAGFVDKTMFQENLARVHKNTAGCR